jgi:dienelactone hydrolase
MRPWVLLIAFILTAADRTVPPAGIPIPPERRTELEDGLRKLNAKIDRLRHPLLPDVLIFREAVRYALQYNEFFRADEFDKARALLRAGEERADALAATPSWTTATGLVPRGYVSKIDGSVQPYGLVVPPSWTPTAARDWRLDIWLHGRGETLSEVNFLTDRMRNPGEFTPRDTIVLHLYGRYCNANKFAGEVDLFEALADVKRHYRIDENRILVRGFSMGGAAAWHMAVHHAGLWAAAAPGAGFAELQRYQKISDAERDAMPAWYTKLWRLYDATGYAANLYNTAVVAYSGEVDPQRQAATIMGEAMAAEGMRLTHIIGPNTAHRYHPDSKPQIDARLDAIAARGRDAYPRRVKFVTYTLRYHRMKWVEVDALERHWDRARVDVEVADDRTIRAITNNIAALTFHLGPGANLLDRAFRVSIVIDGQSVPSHAPGSDGSWTAHLVRRNGNWTLGGADAGLRKKHGLQGPIDDAFMDSFIFVKPSGAASAWTKSEMDRAIREWRSQFRGEARVKMDTEVTAEDIAGSNLVLWGDPASNKLVARIADRLPVEWAPDRMPILIYPNPLNPERYVVLNSGFTFREADYLTNSRQVPRLPDWAVVDTTVPPDAKTPGRIVSAGFFDEQWRRQK